MLEADFGSETRTAPDRGERSGAVREPLWDQAAVVTSMRCGVVPAKTPGTVTVRTPAS